MKRVYTKYLMHGILLIMRICDCIVLPVLPAAGHGIPESSPGLQNAFGPGTKHARKGYTPAEEAQ